MENIEYPGGYFESPEWTSDGNFDHFDDCETKDIRFCDCAERLDWDE